MQVSKDRLVVQLKTLMGLSATVNSSLDAMEIRRRAVESAAVLVDAERASLLLSDPKTRDLCFETACEDGGPALSDVRLGRDQGIAGWVVENASSAIVNDVHSDPRYVPSEDETSAYVTRNMVAVPVLARGGAIGSLQAMNKRGGAFDEYDCELMEALSHHVAVAIENADLYVGIREAFYQTAEALALTLEKADPCTGEHIRRVMEFAEMIAVEMGLDDAQIEDVRLVAILHDIGKIGVPSDVLGKPDTLDHEELESMKAHSATGAEILGKVSRFNPIVAAVRSHHERFDGRGYPDGLSGDDIPLAGRIVAVADAFDAMTSERPYRQALSRERAIEELRAGGGSQFDPEITALFLGLLGQVEP